MPASYPARKRPILFSRLWAIWWLRAAQPERLALHGGWQGVLDNVPLTFRDCLVLIVFPPVFKMNSRNSTQYPVITYNGKDSKKNSHTHTHTHTHTQGLPWWHSGLRICLECRGPNFDPWVGKIPWRRKWQLTRVLVPGESQGQEKPGGLQSKGLQRVRCDWAHTRRSIYLYKTEYLCWTP